MSIEDRLALWVLGQLSPEEDVAVARRVAEDPELARLAAQYREVLRLLPSDGRTDLPELPAALLPTPTAPPASSPWTGRVAAVAAAVALIVVGAGLGRLTVADPPAGPVTEAVAVAGSLAADAELINHTWGVELLITVEDTAEGEDYVVWFVDRAGGAVAAGGFVGDADLAVDCRLNGPLLREETTAIRVTDDTGAVVLQADLPARDDATPGGVPTSRDV